MTCEFPDFPEKFLPPGSTNVSLDSVATARNLWRAGDYAGAWRELANAGDRYADNAAGVVGQSNNAGDTFFKNLVQNYWESTVGADVYQQKFSDVASLHLGNYLGFLEQNQGLKPDTLIHH